MFKRGLEAKVLEKEKLRYLQCLYINQDVLCFDVAVTQTVRRKEWGMEDDSYETPSRNMCRLQLLTRSESNLCAVGKIFPFFIPYIL